MVKQISLFLENKKGRLAHVCRVLGDAGINIRALSLADTADFGVLRLIVDDPAKTNAVLSENGFVASITDVMAIQVPDVPGGLADALEKMDKAGLDVEYMYAFIGTNSQNALVIIRVDSVEGAAQIMEGCGINVLNEEQVYSL